MSARRACCLFAIKPENPLISYLAVLCYKYLNLRLALNLWDSEISMKELQKIHCLLDPNTHGSCSLHPITLSHDSPPKKDRFLWQYPIYSIDPVWPMHGAAPFVSSDQHRGLPSWQIVCPFVASKDVILDPRVISVSSFPKPLLCRGIRWQNMELWLCWQYMGLIILFSPCMRWCNFLPARHQGNMFPIRFKGCSMIKGSLGGETSVLRTFRLSGKELVKERVSKERKS